MNLATFSDSAAPARPSSLTDSMALFLSPVIGYLIGSLPTAEWLGRMVGVDLRNEGSENPGTNNALRLGGPSLAAIVLLVEMTKGAIAVVLGGVLGGDVGAVLAAVGAAMGNVYNMYYGLKGGKGLGISIGTLFAIWPTVVLPVLAMMVATVLITRSSGAAAIVTIVSLTIMAVLWMIFEWPMAWGIEPTHLLIVLSVGLGAVLWRKHWFDSPFSRQSPHSLLEQG